MKLCVNRKIQVLQKFETYELKEFQSSISVAKSCKNFSTNIGVRNLQDFHLTKSLGARNLQDFHLARKVVQETCKIFILQKLVQETCKIFILQDTVGAKKTFPFRSRSTVVLRPYHGCTTV